VKRMRQMIAAPLHSKSISYEVNPPAVKNAAT
jgi:hypothetical protein